MTLSLVSITMASSLLDFFLLVSLLTPPAECGDVASMILVSTEDTPPRDFNIELLPINNTPNTSITPC